MLGPQHLQHLIRYFDEVDLVLSKPMLRKHPPDESGFTNELCALLDAETQAAEGKCSYQLDDLNADLGAAGDGLDFEFTIDTHPHNAAMERHVSQSDFGLVLEYDNKILPEENWSRAYLVQAKRLFRNHRTGAYDGLARFRSVDTQQQARIEQLSKILGADAILYGLYCPPIDELPEIARIQVRALHARNLSRNIFDYGNGLALRDTLRANGGCRSGMWLCPAVGKPIGLATLHNEAFRSALPLTWFIINHFFVGERWCLSFERSRRETTLRSTSANSRIEGVVRGDDQAIQDLIQELSVAGEDKPVPAITVLPRHTITIRATVGRMLPPDTARVRFD